MEGEGSMEPGKTQHVKIICKLQGKLIPGPVMLQTEIRINRLQVREQQFF